MAKKRRVDPEPTPAKKGTQPNAITIRGSGEWKDWLDRLASRLRSKPTGVIDRALAELAERVGFEEPPPRMSS